jgi:glutaredoxin
MAQEFVNAKIQPGKVVVFIKPSCPYCRKTQEILSQLPFKQGLLEFVDITATSHTSEIQDYLKQLTGARTVSVGFSFNSQGESSRVAFSCEGCEFMRVPFLGHCQGSALQGIRRALQGVGQGLSLEWAEGTLRAKEEPNRCVLSARLA